MAVIKGYGTMSVINYIDTIMGNSSTFAPKENHNHINPWNIYCRK